MATGVGPIDALFGLGRSLVGSVEGARQDGVSGAFKGFLNPTPYEQGAQQRGLKEEQAPDIKALEDAIDSTDDVNDFYSQVVPLMARVRYEIGMAATPANEEAYEKVYRTLNEKYQIKGRQLLGLGAAGGDDEGGDAEEAIRMGMMTDSPETTRAGLALKDVFRSRAMNRQTEAMMQRQGAAAPGLEALTEARTRAANAQAARAETAPPPRDPNAPRLGDLDRARRDLDRYAIDPTTGEPITDRRPPQHVLDTYNNRAEALEQPVLEWDAGRGMVDQATLDSERWAQHERNLGRSAPGRGRAPATPTPSPTFGTAPYIPQVQDAPPTPTPQLPQQQQIAQPTPIQSGKALRDQLVAQGYSPEQATALVRQMIAQQNQQRGAGGGAAAPR